MKKIFFFLVGIILLLVGCGNDENYADNNTTSISSKIRWYGTQLRQEGQTRNNRKDSKLWNQKTGISIKFINEPFDPSLIDSIKQIAAQWKEYAGINFNYVTSDKKADIRIAFDWNGNDWLTWSYTGTDAKFVRNQNEPTAVFGGLKYLNQNQFKGDVLRIFGQILGLEYKRNHQHWAESGYWKNTTQLQEYWEDKFDGQKMDWDQVRDYVFIPMTSQDINILYTNKDDDALSVMVWPYYNCMHSTTLLANHELSKGDKLTIAKLYPREELPTIQEAWIDPGYFEWTDINRTSVRLTKLGAEQEYLPDVSDGDQLTSAKSMFCWIDGTFFRGNKLKQAPFFNSSNITIFSEMFRNSPFLTNIPLLDTSSGINFSDMFAYCRSLTTIPKLDTSNGINFQSMFWDCRSLKSIPELDTSNGVNFSGMFTYCKSLTSIPAVNAPNGNNFESMFSHCTSLTNIPPINAPIGTNFSNMFYNCTSLINISNLNVAKGYNFSNMFYNCISLTTAPLLNTSKGTNFSNMFYNCISLTRVSDIDISNGTDFSQMFTYCSSLTSIPKLDTSKGIIFRGMFEGCSSLKNVPPLNTSNGTNFLSMFYGCSSLTTIPKLDTSNGINFSHMFYNCTSLRSIPELDTSNGSYFGSMFYICSALAVKPQLNLSKATNTMNMYYGTLFQNDPS